MMQHLRSAWLLIRRPPPPFKVALMIVSSTCYGAAGFIFFERPGKPELGWLDGFWWAVVSMTTVGYGDYFPSTPGGRYLIAYPIMLLGMGFMAYGLSALAGFLMRADALNRKGLLMATVSNHIVICNYPSQARFAQFLQEIRAQPELRRKAIVLVDEFLEDLPSELAAQDVHFVRGHPSRLDTLERAHVEAAVQAVVLARDPAEAASDDATVATALTLKYASPELHVVAECVDTHNQEILARSGCNSIVCVMSLAPGIMAQELHDPGVVKVIEELTIWDEDINNIFVVPMNLDGTGHTVADLRSWADHNRVTLLGVRGAERIELNPGSERALATGDEAVVVCQTRPQTIELS